jgi:hypothetical protein
MLLTLLNLPVARAQTPTRLAATVRIVNPGVSLTLVNTLMARSLREDASLPLTAGDLLTTDPRGRALLTFGDTVQVLLLARSSLVVLENRLSSDDQLILRLRLDGHAVSTIARPAAALTLETSFASVTADDAHFAVWTDLERNLVVTVADGSVTVLHSDSYTLSPGDALTADRLSAQINSFTSPPYNGARAFGLQSGCEARVAVSGGRLNIRAGSSVGYDIIGDLVDGATVRIMGITEDGLWYRIQRFSGFGWVLTSGVRAECPNLPALPNNSGEANLELFDYEPFEVELLTPFYAAPGENVWLWRWPDSN